MDGRRGDTQAEFFRFLFHGQKKRKKNAGKTGCFYRLVAYRRPDQSLRCLGKNYGGEAAL